MHARPALSCFAAVICGGLLAACGGSGGGGGASNAFATGFVEFPLTLDATGTLATGATATTTTGIAVTIADGTVFRALTGEALTGPVVVRVDDGAEDRSWLEARTGPNDGVLRVQAFLVAAGGTRLPMDTVFTPPLEVDLAAVMGAEIDGTLALEPWRPLLSGTGVTPLGGGGEPPSGVDWLRYESWSGLAASPTVVSIPTSTLTGAHLDDPSIPPPGSVFVGDTIFELPLGPVGTDYPRLCCVKLINPDTHQIVRLGCWPPGLFLPGQARVLGRVGRPPDVRIEIVEVAGERRVRVRSPLGNVFKIRTIVKPAAGVDPVSSDDPTDGSDDESDEDKTYLGFVSVTIIGCGGYAEGIATLELIESLLPAGPDLTTDDSEAEGGVQTTHGGIHNDGRSVQTIAAGFPPGWDVTFGNRTIVIRLPWPPPPIVVTSFTAATLEQRDPFNLLPVGLPIALPYAADDVGVGYDGIAFGTHVDPPGPGMGALFRIDLGAGAAFPPTPLDGLSSGLGLDPVGRAVYVTTSDGTFHALAPATFAPIWSLPGIGVTGTGSDVAVRGDGAFAYVGDATGVVEIDLLRHEVGRTFVLPGAGRPAVSDDGARLAVPLVGGNQVVAFDLFGPATPIPLPTGPDPREVVFMPGSLDAVVACFGTGALVQLPAALAPIVADASAVPGLTSVAAFSPGPGQAPVVLGAGFLANQLHRGVLANPAVPLGWSPYLGPTQPKHVRVVGR